MSGDSESFSANQIDSMLISFDYHHFKIQHQPFSFFLQHLSFISIFDADFIWSFVCRELRSVWPRARPAPSVEKFVNHLPSPPFPIKYKNIGGIEQHLSMFIFKFNFDHLSRYQTRTECVVSAIYEPPPAVNQCINNTPTYFFFSGLLNKSQKIMIIIGLSPMESTANGIRRRCG